MRVYTNSKDVISVSVYDNQDGSVSAITVQTQHGQFVRMDRDQIKFLQSIMNNECNENT